MNTKTNVATTVNTAKCKAKKETLNVIPTPIFILFAEYMGYVSQFNKLAENWCEGKVPEVHVQKIMILEAKCIYRKMVKDYNIKDILYYYESYYPLVLKEYVDKLAEIVKN